MPRLATLKTLDEVSQHPGYDSMHLSSVHAHRKEGVVGVDPESDAFPNSDTPILREIVAQTEACPRDPTHVIRHG
jgi:hypothetical protein